MTVNLRGNNIVLPSRAALQVNQKFKYNEDMSKISKHHADTAVATGVKLFYFRVENDQSQVMFSLCVGGDGIYYYEADSKILTEDENANTPSLYVSYVSMEDVKMLFEALVKAHLGQTDLKITAQEGKVVIEQQQDE